MSSDDMAKAFEAHLQRTELRGTDPEFDHFLASEAKMTNHRVSTDVVAITGPEKVQYSSLRDHAAQTANGLPKGDDIDREVVYGTTVRELAPFDDCFDVTVHRRWVGPPVFDIRPEGALERIDLKVEIEPDDDVSPFAASLPELRNWRGDGKA